MAEVSLIVMLPPRPTTPAIVLDPLRYLWSQAPATSDDAFRHVLGWVGWFVASEDPFPPDPPPPEAGEKPLPPPPPPPTPAYPLGELLGALAALDAATMAPTWAVVCGELDAWLAP